MPSNVEQLLELGLCCPVPDCHGALDVHPEWLTCRSCGRRYRVIDDIPNMLIDEALPPAGPGKV